MVDANSPGLATQVKDDADDSNIDDNEHVAIGTVAYDTATLSGATANAGGTVTYYVEKATPVLDRERDLAGDEAVTNGTVLDSDTFTFTSAGTYEFWAVYSGDANNNGKTSTCLTETVVVDANSPGLATQVKDDADDSNIDDNEHVAIGTVAYDTARPEAAPRPTPSGHGDLLRGEGRQPSAHLADATSTLGTKAVTQRDGAQTPTPSPSPRPGPTSSGRSTPVMPTTTAKGPSSMPDRESGRGSDARTRGTSPTQVKDDADDSQHRRRARRHRHRGLRHRPP